MVQPIFCDLFDEYIKQLKKKYQIMSKPNCQWFYADPSNYTGVWKTALINVTRSISTDTVGISTSTEIAISLGLRPENIVNTGGTICYYGNIDLSNRNYQSLYDFAKIGIVTVYGSFSAANCKLTSLRGCPTRVEGNFDVSGNYLKNIEYGPRFVGGNYNASNNCIDTLEHFPNTTASLVVGGTFDVSRNFLDNLNGIIPKYINGSINVSDNYLTTLDANYTEASVSHVSWTGVSVRGYFNCSKNLITSLAEGPLTVLSYYDASYNALTAADLLGFIIGGSLILNNNVITTLTNITTINGELNLSNNLLELVDIGTWIVKGNLDLSHNQISGQFTTANLTGVTGSINMSYNSITDFTTGTLPTTVNGNLSLNNNSLTTLVYTPVTVTGNVDISSNSLTGFTAGVLTTIYGSLNASFNRITALTNLTTAIGNTINLSNNRITTLVVGDSAMFPAIVSGDLNVSNNLLTTLDLNDEATNTLGTDGTSILVDIKNSVTISILGSFDCSYNSLTSLKASTDSTEEIPIKSVGKSYNCSNNLLTSLLGLPTTLLNAVTKISDINGDLNCSYNRISTLVASLPTRIKGIFNCSSNRLTNLNGMQLVNVGSGFDCSSNQITTLAYLAQTYWTSYFNCSYNSLTTLASITNVTGTCKILRILGNFISNGNTISDLIVLTKNKVVGGLIVNR